MSKTLKRVVYRSRPTAFFREAVHLDGIFAASVIRNARRGVTGAMVAFPGRFVQVLEGEAHAVVDLLGRIRMDPRHSDLEVVGHRDVCGRLFTGWSMARIRASELPTEDHRRIIETGTGCEIVGLLVRVVESHPMDRLRL
jgi:hypothetical protein